MLYSPSSLFIVFLSDLDVTLNSQSCIVKYADDSTIISPVYNNCDISSDLVNDLVLRLDKR